MKEVPPTTDSNSMAALASKICTQINSVFTKPTSTASSPLDITVAEISAVAGRRGKIFLHGVGREGLMMKALAMRLAHLGLSIHCVGDVTAPPISSSDLLIASAGPGGFSTVDAICGVARSNGGLVLLITARPDDGSCVRYASAVAHIPAQTMADDGGAGAGEVDGNGTAELLPMGSLYEAAMFVLFEMVVFKLASVLGQSSDEIRSRHTNLE